jgi:hypothetical protein
MRRYTRTVFLPHAEVRIRTCHIKKEDCGNKETMKKMGGERHYKEW